MEIDTIKISELAEGSQINNDSILVYNMNGQTKKITFQNLKNAVISALASEVSQLDADLEDEVTARAAADTALAADITAEKTTRQAADTTITTNLNKVTGDIADIYDNTASYDVGDFCIYDKQLYKCNTAISTPEDWDSTHWDAVNTGNELKQIIQSLDGLENNTHKFTISTSDTTIVLPPTYRGVLITSDSDSTRCGIWMIFTYSDGNGSRTAMFSTSTGVVVTGTSNGLKVNTNSGSSYGLIIDISKHVTSIS